MSSNTAACWFWRVASHCSSGCCQGSQRRASRCTLASRSSRPRILLVRRSSTERAAALNVSRSRSATRRCRIRQRPHASAAIKTRMGVTMARPYAGGVPRRSAAPDRAFVVAGTQQPRVAQPSRNRCSLPTRKAPDNERRGPTTEESQSRNIEPPGGSSTRGYRAGVGVSTDRSRAWPQRAGRERRGRRGWRSRSIPHMHAEPNARNDINTLGDQRITRHLLCSPWHRQSGQSLDPRHRQ